MQSKLLSLALRGIALPCLSLQTATGAFGAAIWTNAAGGAWRDGVNWNGGKAPNLALGGVYLSNAVTKTITVDASTPASNLWVNSLNIWGPPNATNTLLLLDLGAARALVVSNQTLTLANRGAIVNNGVNTVNCGGGGVPPAITEPPVSLTVTQGFPASFRVTATGTPAPTNQWRFGPDPGGDLPGATSSSFNLSDAQASDAGHYRVVFSNASGSVTSVVALLRVLLPPSIATAQFSGDTFNISFPSVNGLNYVIEFRDHLDDPAWTPIQSAPGTGALLTFMDSPPWCRHTSTASAWSEPPSSPQPSPPSEGGEGWSLDISGPCGGRASAGVWTLAGCDFGAGGAAMDQAAAACTMVS